MVFVGNGVPAFKLARPAGKDVLEATERPSARDGNGQEIGLILIPDRLDEVLHVPIGIAGALAPHRQPAIRILVVGIVRVDGVTG